MPKRVPGKDMISLKDTSAQVYVDESAGAGGAPGWPW